MAHHAYYLAGQPEEGIGHALAFAKAELGLGDESSPDVVVLRHGLFSVDDARRVNDIAYRAPMQGSRKAVIISATRLFHEAQNALLKLFEEPPESTTLILIVPSEGMLLPTLVSRLMRLPTLGEGEAQISPEAEVFLSAAPAAREKQIANLVDRSKSDKEEEKQKARGEAIRLMNGITGAAHARLPGAKGADREAIIALLEDVSAFTPILYERSAPLKLIFEHLLLVLPATPLQGRQ